MALHLPASVATSKPSMSNIAETDFLFHVLI